MLPDNIKAEIDNYSDIKVRPGTFLYAFLCNNLRWAITETQNLDFEDFPDILSYLTDNVAPTKWGDHEAVEKWLKKPEKTKRSIKLE